MIGAAIEWVVAAVLLLIHGSGNPQNPEPR